MRTITAISSCTILILAAGCVQLRPTSTAPFSAPGSGSAPDLLDPPAARGAAAAAGDSTALSYTYVEAGATFLDVNDINGSTTSEDVDSYYIGGSLGMGLFHLIGGFANQSTDFQNTDTALYRLGVGAHLDLVAGLDLVGDVSWLFSDVSSDLTALEGTNNGYQIRGGARWMALPWEGGGLELEGNLIWIDLDNLLASDTSVFGFEAGGRLHLLGPLSVGALYTKFEDDDMIGVNARVSF